MGKYQKLLEDIRIYQKMRRNMRRIVG